jgi:3-hydroxy acid dehydrogenase / malonic semialdehyde reductase
MASDFTDKWIIVTGASSGFGAATALAFGKKHAKLLLGARRVDRLKAVAAQALKAGASEAHVHPLDVAQTASVQAFAQWTATHTPKIDFLINNAGGALGLEPVAEAVPEVWRTPRRWPKRNRDGLAATEHPPGFGVR